MNKTLKRMLPLLVTFLLVAFLFRNGIRWNDLQAVYYQAKWGWLFFALFSQASSYGAVTWLNEILLRHYGASVPFGKQFVIQLAMAFIESVVPSASISGAVLRVRLLKPHGVSPDIATVTTLAEMTLIATSVAILALPVAGLAMIQGMQGLSPFSRGEMLLIGAVILTAAIIWQWRNPHFARVRRLFLQQAARFWDDRIRSRWHQQLSAWPSERILQRGHYLGSEMMVLLRARPYKIILSLTARAGFEVLGLAMCFLALGQILPWPTMILVYALTLVANAMSAIPGAIGLTEISLAALYAQFGIPSETALAIALAYRLTDYWLPRLVGGGAWLWLERRFPQRIPEPAS